MPRKIRLTLHWFARSLKKSQYSDTELGQASEHSAMVGELWAAIALEMLLGVGVATKIGFEVAFAC